MPGDAISKLAAGLSSQPRVSSALSLQAIESILRTLFWVSLKTEEHASLTCSVTFGSPSDFAMVKKHYRDQPSCVPFERIRTGKANYAGLKCRRCKVGGLLWAYPEDFQFNGERAATLLMGQEGSLGRTSLRYLRRLIWRRLQVSMMERMAAILGPAS